MYSSYASSYAPIDWNVTNNSNFDSKLNSNKQLIPDTIKVKPKLTDLLSTRLLSGPNSIVCPIGFKTVLELLVEIYPRAVSNELSQQLLSTHTESVPMSSSDSLVYKSYDIIVHTNNLNIDSNKFYYATVLTDPVKIANTINNIISKKTRGLIECEILPESLNAMITIINIIYFMGLWKFPFNSKETFTGPWMLDNKINVTYMQHSKNKLPYCVDSNFQILELPYEDESFVFGICLPLIDNKMKTVGSDKINKIGAKAIVNAINSQKNTIEIDLVRIPKFSIRYTVPSNQISEAFQLNPLTKMFQEVFISVNEKGSKAASVTLVQTYGYDSKSIQFVADRPFVYYIKHNPTNTIMFVGRMDCPNN
jgi:serine protease inhibitor